MNGSVVFALIVSVPGVHSDVCGNQPVGCLVSSVAQSALNIEPYKLYIAINRNSAACHNIALAIECQAIASPGNAELMVITIMSML